MGAVEGAYHLECKFRGIDSRMFLGGSTGTKAGADRNFAAKADRFQQGLEAKSVRFSDCGGG